MKRYNPKDIEPKWQKIWEDQGIYRVNDETKPKKYILEYFPYPSGAAMHVGHVRNYAIGDALARFNRMAGYNVLHPMGWDGFGLPAENYAIKNHVSPREAIDTNTTKFKQQLIQMGFSYDWSREIDSTDPKYYRWTQWFFLMLFKKGLAYQQESLQWWCPHDKTVLANEQVEAGRCWRCGHEVEKKSLKQWFFKITDYADRLADDLDDVNWSESIKSMQRNWIGRSVGVEIDFTVTDTSAQHTTSKVTDVTVFTTRADTLFGATFIVMAPDHHDAMFISTKAQEKEVDEYIRKSFTKSEIERQETSREKTGVFTGSYATNPLSQEKIPIWIADYVIARYGTGAVMGVPAHDERDFEFSKKYSLPTKRVIMNEAPDEECTHSEGLMINSDKYNNLPSEKAREKISAEIVKKHVGGERVNYKLSDWLISRQRYWGAPIPIIHCPTDGAVAVPDDQLPVVLPEVKSFEPSGDGQSPLANVPEFVNTTCPKCGGPAKRETDTMDGFACSSWYFLRFADPHNDQEPFARNKADFWLPVDDYIGGAEHAVMHLLYARFWAKVMYDEGMISFTEPFTTLRNQGMILAPDGAKMSKSKGNTIEPGTLIDQGYGADAVRIMELFIGPWNQAVNWSIEGMGGAHRFLQRVWTLVQEFKESESAGDNKSEKDIRAAINKTIKKVTEDLESMSFNTAIAAMMEAINTYYKIKAEDSFAAKSAWQDALDNLTQLLAPFAPHMAEELWSELGHQDSVHKSEWPKWNEEYLVSDTIKIAVQVNGKLRDELEIPSDAEEAHVVEKANVSDNVQVHLEGKQIVKTVYVPGKIINFVVK